MSVKYYNGTNSVDIAGGITTAQVDEAISSALAPIGEVYASAGVALTEPAWTTKRFTFSQTIPAGRYQLAFQFSPGKSTNCWAYVNSIAQAYMSTDYGAVYVTTPTFLTYTSDQTSLTLSYGCALMTTGGSQSAAVTAVLIRVR